MKIHEILIRHFFLSFSDPSWPSRFLGSDIFGFFRNLLSKFTTVKSKLKFCLKHLSLGPDIGNLEVPKQLKSAKFWTGIIQILILATQLGFEKNRNFLAIFRHFGHCGGGHVPPQVLGYQLTLFGPRGGRLCPPYYYVPLPIFLDDAASLQVIN